MRAYASTLRLIGAGGPSKKKPGGRPGSLSSVRGWFRSRPWTG